MKQIINEKVTTQIEKQNFTVDFMDESGITE